MSSKIAIIGSGIAGLGCAHFLRGNYSVTLFEKDSYVGGHANTVTVQEPTTHRELAIDTGFMVFNYETYPCLTRLFRQLNVPVKRTDMSFSVRHESTGVEFCGTSLNHLFAQRRNLLRPSFYRMLGSIHRFNSDAIAALQDPTLENLSLSDYVAKRGYGSDFLNLYLIPMSGAVWSTPPEKMLKFPARTLLRFFHNHGFLGLSTQHPWWTVDGGSREYVRRLTADWSDLIRCHCPVRQVTRRDGGVEVVFGDHEKQWFDKVIFATHGYASLALLTDPTDDEGRYLKAFRYQPNVATLHTDSSVMPRTRRAWASWNYSIPPQGSASDLNAPTTTYWMNRLQGVSDRENYFVSINAPQGIPASQIIKTIPYEHPLFTLEAIRAQPEIPRLNQSAVGGTETYYCGAWTRYGFHEDGLLSAVEVSRLLLGRDPWEAPNRQMHAELQPS